MENINPLNNWVKTNRKTLVIAGPCSVESPEQFMATAKEMKSLNVDILRGGIWKPRTRPGGFEGRGLEALKWIKEVKDETGLPFATEVGSPEHVELALKYNVDILWIGARTTVNPFTMQHIADALKGVDVPVLVKNPVNPDLALWIGGIERIYNAGIKNIGAIHRGFTSFEKAKYRNLPNWQIGMELKRQFPDLPLICDPSHIAGNRDLIEEVCQRAMDLDFDGLMIESHVNPSVALSDASQQVTPESLGNILNNLIIKSETSTNVEFISQLETLRGQIDKLDKELVEVLSARVNLADKIGEYKKENSVTTFQQSRWEAIYNTRRDWATKMNINPDFISEVFKSVHAESVRRQEEIISSLSENA